MLDHYTNFAYYSEDFLLKNGVNALPNESVVQFFCKVSLRNLCGQMFSQSLFHASMHRRSSFPYMTVAAVPYIHISMPKLPLDQGVVITSREGDALRSSVWTPVHDPDEVAGTIHWIITRLRGIWYVSFTFGGRYWLIKRLINRFLLTMMASQITSISSAEATRKQAESRTRSRCLHSGIMASSSWENTYFYVQLHINTEIMPSRILTSPYRRRLPQYLSL